MVRLGSRALGVVPLQSRHILPAVRSSGTGSGFHEVLCPFDDVTRTSPMNRGYVLFPQRFRSQGFSPSQRFPGTSELCGLVSCRCRPWGSPFRALILAGIACASRRRMLPCSSPPPYLRCDACDLILRVSPTPALVARWPGHPPELGHRFHRPAPHALAHGPAATSPTSWIPRTGVTSFRWLRLLRSFPPPASPRTGCTAFADTPRPMLSWVLPPQSLDPVEPRTLS